MITEAEMYSRSPRSYIATEMLLDQLDRTPKVCKYCGLDDEEALVVGSTIGEIVIECASGEVCIARVEAATKEADATQ